MVNNNNNKKSAINPIDNWFERDECGKRTEFLLYKYPKIMKSGFCH